MHHHFRSKFLIDIPSAMGYCSSYSEVQRFEKNAASSVDPDVLGCANESDMMLLFAADNIDHNIVSIDGKGTFHGMGVIAAITPRRQIMKTILRRKISDLNIIAETQVDIVQYRFTKHTRRTIEFQQLSLPVLKNVPRDIDILWEVYFRFSEPVPNWQAFMHVSLLHKQYQHPGQFFLPMIGIYSNDKTCILSTLEYFCKLSAKYNVPAVVTFDSSGKRWR